jgi:hypothetical protein
MSSLSASVSDASESADEHDEVLRDRARRGKRNEGVRCEAVGHRGMLVVGGLLLGLLVLLLLMLLRREVGGLLLSPGLGIGLEKLLREE